MANYQKIKGTLDYINLDAKKLKTFENIASRTIEKFGFKEIITPIFEDAAVFIKNTGEDSDIVTKEMYTFKDKGDRLITLRPEGTPAIARCFIENKMYANPGVSKYFYFGPMFRYERPQTGRYRQFNQFGVEAYGSNSPLLDVEIINSAFGILRALGLKDVYIKINSIGDAESRKNYSKALKEYFAKYIDSMCDDCKRRINTNPLRIIDCKVDSKNEAVINAPTINNYLSEASVEYFNKVIDGLKELNIPYEIDYKLVRGLDYYTDTVFEFVAKTNEGESLALGGGGRYADLLKNMCGIDIPGVGYAFGAERLIALMNELNLFDYLKDDTDCVVIGLDEESKLEAFKIANLLRENGKVVEMDYSSTSLKSQFKLADRVNAKYIIIIGETERLTGNYTIKNKEANTQESVNKKDLINYIK